MPLEQGLNSDLQFLILEVKKQGRASLSVIENPTAKKIEKIKSREYFIDNLKNTIEKLLEIQLRKELAREALEKASHPTPPTEDNRASKKVDTKTTPQKSPPLGEAGSSHIP